MRVYRSVVINFTAILAACVFTVAIHAQTPEKTPATDPSKKPIKAKSEPDKALKDFLLDVPYIITPEEEKAFKLLKTAEEREKFIDDFWNRRNPNPDSQENEYREQYYERIAYANEHFSSGIPGWKTDRGRIYVTWGKPDDIESHPSGGAYDKASYEGGGSATTYPFERWFYRHLGGVGDGIEIEFVDQTGSGEYRLATDINDKIVTLGPPQTTDPNVTYLREQDLPFNVQDRNVKLFSTPPVNRPDDIRVIIDSPVIDKSSIGLDLQIGFFRQSENRVMVTFTTQTTNKDLVYQPVGGLLTARLNVFGRLTAVAGKTVGVFEDSIADSATSAELAANKDRRSVYQRAVGLAPGIYRVDIAVRDITSGNKGIVSLGFTVPKYDPSQLSTSSLVLATTLRQTNSDEIGNRFVVGNMKLVPNLTGVYKQGQPVGVYMQIYNAGTDETTLRPSVDVEYIIIRDGKQISSTPEDWSGLSDSSQRLTLSRLLPTENLKPGDYEVKIVTKDRVGGQQVENRASFKIID